MKKPILIIFVDALPYDRGDVIADNLRAKTYEKTVPGIGYSINVKAELFAGLKPDDVGYFCEWNYDPDRNDRFVLKLIAPMLEFFGKRSKFLNRVFHKLITILLKENVYAIPYRILPLLKNSGLTSYEHGFSKPTVLSDGGFERILYSEEGVNDKKIFEKTLEQIKAKKSSRLFVSTAQLDGVMHHYGMKCKEYEDQITLINSYVTDIVKEFMAVNGDDALYFIISDHGMATVENPVDYNIETKFGPASKNRYIHFVDATFYRVWVKDSKLKEEMVCAFNELNNGKVLTDAEREKYGVVDLKHGDIIYMLDEGYQFAPSFFGNGACKAMHGYESELESQLGIFISNADGVHGEKINATDIYARINQYI